MPPSLADWVSEDHLVWTVLGAVDQMDLSAFYGAYRSNGQGRAAYDLAMMAAPEQCVARSSGDDGSAPGNARVEPRGVALILNHPVARHGRVEGCVLR